MLWKMTQAIIIGKCLTIKTSSITPLCDIRIVEAAQTIFPPGAVNIVIVDDDISP
jgi:acyl-CoA reductase-like NAD-dependent aldehyde dehydrogenase